MNEQTKKTIGKNIKIHREKWGWSQEELAKRVGKQTATYIAFIEKGERNITTVDLIMIAKQLGTTVAGLIGEKKMKNMTFKEALRASRDLTKSDRKKIEHYFNFIKNKKGDE